MSKKELLERISRNPADGKARRPDAPPPPVVMAAAAPVAPLVGDAAVTTRVSGTVVRRRQQNTPEPEPVPVVVRRRPVDVPVSTPAPRVEARVEAPRRAPEPEAVVVAPVVEEVVEVEAVVHEVETVEEAPVIEAPPTVEVPEPVAVVEEAPPVVHVEPEVRAPRVESRPVAVPPVQDKGVPSSARFEGLGRAVVMPPPGYDPTNPNAFRRRPVAAGPGGHQNAPSSRAPAPAAPAQPEDYRRRRDDDFAVSGEEEARRRRNRAQPTMAEAPGMRRRPRRKVVGGQKSASPGPKASKRKIRIDNLISVGQLAHELGVKAAVVIKELMGMGRMATVNEMLDLDTASLIAGEFEYEVVNAGFQETNFLQHVADEEEEEGALDRPPVVTIMGHVDHGKTTLLDAIRQAKVAAGEAGGITQHIGAYQVDSDGNKITFIDTPGHAAFTQMRARGANLTDIVVLVVAADDGVQAQTEEAISHAKAAGVPIVVAVNKMDKPGVSADPIKNRLGEFGLVPEEWGGDVMFVPVSALKKQGIDELLEAILLQAEVLELKANPDRHAEGVVIEARLERGRGAVATLLVQKGTLKRGDNVVLGSSWGRVRAMHDHNGGQLKEAPPSTPIEIFGLSEVPGVGEPFHVVKNEKDARTIAEHRAQEKRDQALVSTGRRTAADIYAQADAAEKKTLNVIVKSDVQGSLEALRGALGQLEINGTELRVLHSAVGDISESDVNLAAANGALLIGFSVKVDAMARQAAESQGVVPELYDIIYAVLDRVTALMSGLLGPQYKEVRQGAAEIRAVYNISKFGKIAGCHVIDGKVSRNAGARLMRNGEKIWEGKIKTLKRFKDDAREVSSGYDCGIGLDGFDEIQEGDIVETHVQEQINA